MKVRPSVKRYVKNVKLLEEKEKLWLFVITLNINKFKDRRNYGEN